MKPQKSSKKTYLIVVVFVLLIGISLGGYLVLKSGVGAASINQRLNSVLEQNKKAISGCQPNPDDKNKDSDNDGLMDWQENTWGTNACKPDTDGDGYLDGEEVAAGYDPAKPAPDDKLVNQESTEPRPLPNNLTRALAQSLVKKMMEGEIGLITDASDPLLAETSNQVVNQAIQETVTKAMIDFSLPYIPDGEIIISSDNSQAAIQNYAGEIVKTIDQWIKQTSINYQNTSESELFYNAVQNNDFAEIDKYINFYQRISEDIKKIPAPSNLKDIHKEQIGIFWIMANIHQAVREINTDPLKASLALEQYGAVSELVNQMLLKLAERIK